MPEVTYGRLDEVLRALGFSARVAEEKARVYRHEATGAVIILPLLPDGQVVRPHHLVSVRMTLDAFGVADPLDFNAKLQKAS